MYCFIYTLIHSIHKKQSHWHTKFLICPEHISSVWAALDKMRTTYIKKSLRIWRSITVVCVWLVVLEWSNPTKVRSVQVRLWWPAHECSTSSGQQDHELCISCQFLLPGIGYTGLSRHFMPLWQVAAWGGRRRRRLPLSPGAAGRHLL